MARLNEVPLPKVPPSSTALFNPVLFEQRFCAVVTKIWNGWPESIGASAPLNVLLYKSLPP